MQHVYMGVIRSVLYLDLNYTRIRAGRQPTYPMGCKPLLQHVSARWQVIA